MAHHVISRRAFDRPKKRSWSRKTYRDRPKKCSNGVTCIRLIHSYPRYIKGRDTRARRRRVVRRVREAFERVAKLCTCTLMAAGSGSSIRELARALRAAGVRVR